MIVLYVVSALLIAAKLTNGVNYDDIRATNMTCNDKDSCRNMDKRNRMSDIVDWSLRNCFCDDDCVKYGDCCVNADKFNSKQQQTAINDFECVTLRQFGSLYMQHKCPESFNDLYIKERCESRQKVSADPIGGLPITSHKTRTTYQNYYCALCNDDIQESTFWKPRLECPALTSYSRLYGNITQEFLKSQLVLDGDTWGVYIDKGGVAVFHQCYIDPVFPDTIEMFLRKCQPALSVCADDWTDFDVTEKCQSYTAYLYNLTDGYRNVHCAICNHVQVEELTCFEANFKRTSNGFDFSRGAFAMLMDITDSSGSEFVGSVKKCKETELYDPFFKICRNVVCGRDDFVLVNGKCLSEDYMATSTEISTSNGTTDASFNTCPKFLLEKDDYEERENSTIFIPAYKKLYQLAEYMKSGNSVIVCAIGGESVEKFNDIMSYVSMSGIFLSMVCLVLHLGAFFIVPELKNLSGKNMASLCVALLIAYTAFLLSQARKITGPACVAVAILMYYGFLSTFHWMAVMAFDVWRTLQQASAEFRVSSGKQTKKFFTYSIVAWLIPATFVIVAATLDQHGHGRIPTYYIPGFGVNNCWFSHRKALVVFFAAPLIAIMAVNSILFILSARIVSNTTSTAQKFNSCSPRTNFKLYIRLAAIMGLTWIVGIVAGYLNSEISSTSVLFQVLWYSFIVLNTLQGVFIFINFTCNKRVWGYLVNHFKPAHRTSTYSGTWSHSKSNDTRKSALSTEDTDVRVPMNKSPEPEHTRL